MAVGVETAPALLPVDGVAWGVAQAGIKSSAGADVAVMSVADGAHHAAVYTRNAFCAAPVVVAKRHGGRCSPRFLLINSGNANAGLGDQGVDDALTCCQALASLSGCAPETVLPFSTGVIGEPLPVANISAALPEALGSLSADGWSAAAAAIMTTDTRPKGVSRQLEIRDQPVTITGIAKGSGMIRPNMATMLAFVATDAEIAPELLSNCLTTAVEGSFNAITVDGDTSTNDACVLLATGRGGCRLDESDVAAVDQFQQALNEVCVLLAQAIIRDGEGATKFVTVSVNGGRDRAECMQVAETVAHSPLVKTALFAADANWGRILAAVGRAGVEGLDVGNVSIYLDEVCIVRDGKRDGDYVEALGARVLGRQQYEIRIELERGDAVGRMWTCDLSYDYIKINAEYRS